MFAGEKKHNGMSWFRPGLALPMLAAAVCGAMLIGSGTAALADIIQLKNGEQYSGSMSRQGDVMQIRTDDGKIITAKPGDIASVTLTSSTTPAEAAAAEWAKDSQQIKAANDLQTIIDLHQKFLDQFPNVPLATDVKSSLEVYKQLLTNDGVKFRGRWIPRAQIDVIVKQWTEAAKPAVDLYKAGQLKESLEAAKAALLTDKDNPDLLTVAGLTAFRLSNMPQARTYFTTLAAADPTSVLAENNLAVVATVQKSPAEGLSHYIKALQIKPDYRPLLDNIAEALNSYINGGGDKNNSNYKLLQKQYQPAEQKMEAEMAKPENGGLARWGATWVAKDQLAKFNKYQSDARDAAQKLTTQYKTARNYLAQLESQLTQANNQVNNQVQTIDTYNNQILAGGQFIGNGVLLASQRDGAIQNLNLMQNYQQQLQQQHDQFIASAGGFFTQAERLLKSLTDGAVGGFTGAQKIIDLGEEQNPPSPVAVADAPTLPTMPELPAIVQSPPPVLGPPIITTPTYVQQAGYGNTAPATGLLNGKGGKGH